VLERLCSGGVQSHGWRSGGALGLHAWCSGRPPRPPRPPLRARRRSAGRVPRRRRPRARQRPGSRPPLHRQRGLSRPSAARPLPSWRRAPRPAAPLPPSARARASREPSSSTLRTAARPLPSCCCYEGRPRGPCRGAAGRQAEQGCGAGLPSTGQAFPSRSSQCYPVAKAAAPAWVPLAAAAAITRGTVPRPSSGFKSAPTRCRSPRPPRRAHQHGSRHRRCSGRRGSGTAASSPSPAAGPTSPSSSPWWRASGTGRSATATVRPLRSRALACSTSPRSPGLQSAAPTGTAWRGRATLRPRARTRTRAWARAAAGASTRHRMAPASRPSAGASASRSARARTTARSWASRSTATAAPCSTASTATGAEGWGLGVRGLRLCRVRRRAARRLGGRQRGLRHAVRHRGLPAELVRPRGYRPALGGPARRGFRRRQARRRRPACRRARRRRGAAWPCQRSSRLPCQGASRCRWLGGPSTASC